jgi:hypothetical protein
MRRYLFSIGAATLLTCAIGFAQNAQTEKHGVDLGIGRGPDSHRPNILVAWRNTERILEVEVLVRNLGDRPGLENASQMRCLPVRVTKGSNFMSIRVWQGRRSTPSTEHAIQQQIRSC